MNLFKINCDGVIYWVAAANQEEAVNHLSDEQIENTGELDCPLQDWKIDLIPDPENHMVVYDEYEEGSDTPITIPMSEEMQGLTKPETLACSEWG